MSPDQVKPTPSTDTTTRKRKRGEAQDAPEPQDPRETSFDEAERLERILGTLKGMRTILPEQLGLLDVAIDEVLGGYYSQDLLPLLDQAIEKPNGLSLLPTEALKYTSLVNIANRHRTNLLNLCRIVVANLETAKPDESRDGDLQGALQRAREAPSPSEAAKHSNFVIEQKKRPIRIGRPFEATGLPVALFHSIFSRFHTLCRDGGTECSSKDRKAAYQLLVAAADVYTTEAHRLRAMTPHLISLLGEGMHGGLTYSEYRPDGVIFHDGIPLLIMEAKNEIGTGGSDPDVQGAFSFRKIWADSSNANVLNACCCPTFVLSVAGPRMTIFGAVLVDEFIVQALTETLGLANFPDPIARAQYIATIMVALRTCLQELKPFYRHHVIPAPTPQPNRCWPWFQKFGDFSLTYTSLDLLRMRVGGAMYNALARRTGEGTGDGTASISVKVKYTPQYCEVAHRLLATAGFAPELLHYERLENDWVVVVMKEIAGPNLESAGIKLPSRAQSDIQAALRLLHKENLVFGDLRPPNVMLYDRQSSSKGLEQGAMLVDFDWAGSEGVARYPPSLNTGVRWAKGVEEAGFITREHDNEMLQSLCT